MQVSVVFLFFRFKLKQFLLFSYSVMLFFFNSVQASNVCLELWIREQIVIHHGCKIELI